MHFCHLIFKNYDLFKFAQSFHAMLMSKPFSCFAQALICCFNLEFQTSLVGCAANHTQFSGT